MDVFEYIKPELLILIPVLYVIGIAIKKASVIANRWIPLILGASGIVLSVIYVMSTSPLDNAQTILMAIFTAFTQGILVSGVSVYANQIYKQFKDNGTKDDTANTEEK